MATDLAQDWPPKASPRAPMQEGNPSPRALIAPELLDLFDRGYVRGWQNGNYAARGRFRMLASHAAGGGDVTA